MSVSLLEFVDFKLITIIIIQNESIVTLHQIIIIAERFEINLLLTSNDIFGLKSFTRAILFFKDFSKKCINFLINGL